ncbi:MAG: hypothetical protein AB7G11_06745 [Phycisphaerales bacterium]
MRWVIDLLTLVIAVAMLAGLVWFHRQEDDQELAIKQTLAARNRLELEIRYRSISRTAELNARGWPNTVDPNWFETDPPRNPLISAECPWVEVASLDDAGLQNPTVRMTLDGTLAGFWYNPYLGILRARVPVMLSDQDAVELYNRINSTRLSSIFQDSSAHEDTATTALVQAQKNREAQENALDPTRPRDDSPPANTKRPTLSQVPKN